MRRLLRFTWTLALGLACGGKAQETAERLDPPLAPGAPATGEVSPETASSEPEGDCEPAARRCKGTLLEQCSSDRTWQTLEDCGSAGLCDAEGGTCIAGCLPRQMRCNGAELQQCKDGHTGFETVDVCASALLCRLGEVSCIPPCTPGVVNCFGPSVQRCNDERYYTLVEFCPAGCDPGRAACAFPGAED